MKLPTHSARHEKTVSKGVNSRKKWIISAAITGTIILLLLFLPLSQAVQVYITTDKTDYTEQPVIFTISVIIEANELLPVDNLTLIISDGVNAGYGYGYGAGGFSKTSVFSPDGTPIENCGNLIITPLPVEQNYYGYGYETGYGHQDYGYGYRYGYDAPAGYGYQFGYGYGYGYQATYPTQLKYEVKWSFEDDAAPDGIYSAILNVKCSGDGTTHSYQGSTSFNIDTTPPVVPPNPDFSISVNPTSGTVTQGGSTTTTVSVSSIAGFAESVSLSASGLPSGASVAFSPLSGTPSFTSALTISTASTTLPGTYTITLTGTGGGKTHSTTYTLTVTEAVVPPVPDFSISVSPTSGSAVQGESATATVSVSSIEGFSSTVSLSASGLPSGATASFSPLSGTPSFTSTLTISASSTTPAGTYMITITGTGGGKTHSSTYTLTVAAVGVPDFSVSVSPSSGSAVQGESATATVSVSSIEGFSSTVSLSASGLPSGATASFSPLSGTPSFTSTLTISASSTTPAGTYMITITGTGGGKTHSSTYTLTVTTVVSPAEFEVSNLSISPDQVKPEEPVTVSAKVTNVGGQEGSYEVEFKVRGVLEDTESVTLSSDESTTVQFTTSKSEEGTYTVEVDGLTGSFTVKKPAVFPWSVVVAVIIVLVLVGIFYWRKQIFIGLQKLLKTKKWFLFFRCAILSRCFKIIFYIWIFKNLQCGPYL